MHKISLSEYDILFLPFSQWFESKVSRYPGKPFAALVDQKVLEYWAPVLEPLFEKENVPCLSLPAHEKNKNIDTCKDVWDWMMAEKLDRGTCLLNIGGGVTGDLGGFCAATFKRGIEFVQVPTTLLAQVDASIGGKVGVNFHGVKNMLGQFCNPQEVIIDRQFLSTLPLRELRSGYAEIVKHALVHDPKLWEALQEKATPDAIPSEELIFQAIAVKQFFVEADPLEKNQRKALNFGHTVGHALESWSHQTAKPLLHGEAVITGMLCEAYISYRKKHLSKTELDKIFQWVIRAFHPDFIPSEAVPALATLTLQDKKNTKGSVRCVGIRSIGSYILDMVITEHDLQESILFLQERLEKK